MDGTRPLVEHTEACRFVLFVLFFTGSIRFWDESVFVTLATLATEDVRDGGSVEVAVEEGEALWDGASLMVTVLTGLDIVTGSCEWTELR